MKLTKQSKAIKGSKKKTVKGTSSFRYNIHHIIKSKTYNSTPPKGARKIQNITSPTPYEKILINYLN